MRDGAPETGVTAAAEPAAASQAAPRARPFSLSPVSSLLRRILFINAVGLGLLVGGVLYLNQFREGLIDLRGDALRTHGAIIAIAVAEAAGERGLFLGVDPVRANLVLRRLARPAGVRARLYDRRGRLIADTRSFSDGSGSIETAPLPPPETGTSTAWLDRLEKAYSAIADWMSPPPPLYRETTLAGIAAEPEIYAALESRTVRTVRANSDGELIISVAMPVQRLKAVMGALVVSTEGGDIAAIVRAERIAILRVALVATLVSVALSALLASTIARPLRKLAEAAIRSGATSGTVGNRPQAMAFPDYSRRSDEVGQLSGALRHMAGALTQRIEAIERFAADVAHEIKNPLTSLRSAVETLPRASTDAHRERLLAVITEDVKRMDRLVTDISNASRLDAELSREAAGPLAIAPLLETVAEITGTEAAEHSVQVIAAASRPGLTVTGIEGRLGQVFLNLVTNAISFSPPGGIVRMRAALHGDAQIAVTVEDDGPGIPEAGRDRIFERFYSDRPESEAFGHHSGLGLSISRQIVEAHEGQIWAENRDDGGARFVVVLPRAD